MTTATRERHIERKDDGDGDNGDDDDIDHNSVRVVRVCV